MSSQRGNDSRTRSQKYKNITVFKNDKHDKTPQIKIINNMKIDSVCERCKHILEWKIKYKKYKPLKNLKKCTKCQEKTIRDAYHTICNKCAKESKICPKCGQSKEIVPTSINQIESTKLEGRLKILTETLPERKKRTVLRHLAKNKEEIILKYKELTANEKEEEIDLLKLFPSLNIRDSDMNFPDEFSGSESSEDSECNSD